MLVALLAGAVAEERAFAGVFCVAGTTALVAGCALRRFSNELDAYGARTDAPHLWQRALAFGAWHRELLIVASGLAAPLIRGVFSPFLLLSATGLAVMYVYRPERRPRDAWFRAELADLSPTSARELQMARIAIGVLVAGLVFAGAAFWTTDAPGATGQVAILAALTAVVCAGLALQYRRTAAALLDEPHGDPAQRECQRRHRLFGEMSWGLGTIAIATAAQAVNMAWFPNIVLSVLLPTIVVWGRTTPALR